GWNCGRRIESGNHPRALRSDDTRSLLSVCPQSQPRSRTRLEAITPAVLRVGDNDIHLGGLENLDESKGLPGLFRVDVRAGHQVNLAARADESSTLARPVPGALLHDLVKLVGRRNGERAFKRSNHINAIGAGNLNRRSADWNARSGIHLESGRGDIPKPEGDAVRRRAISAVNQANRRA